MSEYKRLTERSGNGIAIKETSTNDNMSIWNAIERLAELEDKIEDGRLWFTPSSGLRPNPFECAKRWEELWYEVNCELNALKDKMRKGLLREFACKIGDTVYWITSSHEIVKAVVNAIRIVEKRVIYYVEEDGVGEYTIIDTNFYPTKPEAQAKLKEIKGEV